MVMVQCISYYSGANSLIPGSRKQQERLVLFEDLLGRFAVQSRDSHDNRELGDTSISWDQGLAVSRSSGSDEDIDGSSDYDANIGTATPSGQF